MRRSAIRTAEEAARRVLPRSIARPLGAIRVLIAVRYLLVDHGLFRSMRTQRSVDAAGRPIPWYTFPAIAWLDELDFSDAEVFEYGSGHSTLWWQERARGVTSVEHDPDWYAEVDQRVGASTVLLLETDPDRYVAAAEDGSYDVVVIDGVHRPGCAEVAASVLRPGGLLILDNAERYPQLSQRLRTLGLIEIDFTGFSPVNYYISTTSVFLDRAFHRPPRDVQPRVPIGGVPEDVCG